MKTIDIYCDGSYQSSTDHGGYGIVIQNGNRITKYGGSQYKTTSNRMELTAAISALTKMQKDYGRVKARIFSDSKYVVNATKLGWLETWAHSNWVRAKGRELKNKDLWEMLYPFYIYHDVEFYWLESHAGHKFQEMAHNIAYKEAKGD